VQENEAVEREIARALLATRIDELKRWLGRLEGHVEEVPLIELETDLHVIAALARTRSLTRDLSRFQHRSRPHPPIAGRTLRRGCRKPRGGRTAGRSVKRCGRTGRDGSRRVDRCKLGPMRAGGDGSEDNRGGWPRSPASTDPERGMRTEGLPMDGEQEFREEEVARTVVASRIKELRRWLENASAHLEQATLYELETDLQVIETLAGTTAKQLLR
jgi:hypothetical protein